ncbi:MAG: tetratricopeptide repeat protein [Bacteroidetes bacterium]|nr:tetratricopeptide repeat protein [Bacteroidota bacterium]
MIFGIYNTSAQNRKIDSLNKQLLNLNSQSGTYQRDTGIVNTLTLLCWEYRVAGEMEKAKEYCNKGIALAEKVNYPPGMAKCSNNLGIVYSVQANYDSALECYNKAFIHWNSIVSSDSVTALSRKAKKGTASALGNIGLIYWSLSDFPKALDYQLKTLKILEELGDKHGISSTLCNIGLIYQELSDYPKALDHQLRSLKIAEGLADKQSIAAILGNIGLIYKNISEFPKSLEYQLQSLKIKQDINDRYGIAISLANIGNFYYFLLASDCAIMGVTLPDKYSKALGYQVEALKINEEIGNKRGIAAAFGSMGNIYYSLAGYNKALECQIKSVKIYDDLGDRQGSAIALGNIGMIYHGQKKYSLALEYTKKSVEILREIGDLNNENIFQKTFYETYKATGNAAKALEHYERYVLLQDSIFKLDNQKEILRKQMKFDYEKKAAADSVKNVEEQKVKEAQIQTQQAQIKQERTQRYALYGGLTLVIVFAGFIFNRFRVTKRQNRIIEEQKKMVEMKNEEILDSIQYAQRIQQAMLTGDQFLKQHLPEHFVFFRPKDIVSGDFYWVAPLNPPEGGIDFQNPPLGGRGAVLFCTADCTGHGVPGAFMSLLGISFLNEIIKERNITSPGKVLNILRDEIIRNMNPEGRDDIKDGMEIALCRYNFGEKILEYASANIKLLLVRDGNLQELETDAMPVGVGFGASKPFNQHCITLETGDIIYAFSDGFGDQFGGPKGKRFKRGKLNELLLSISNKPVEEQKTILENTFNDWKGNMEQTDDVTVTGIRI